jgi:hypothetical protein
MTHRILASDMLEMCIEGRLDEVSARRSMGGEAWHRPTGKRLIRSGLEARTSGETVFAGNGQQNHEQQ